MLNPLQQFADESVHVDLLIRKTSIPVLKILFNFLKIVNVSHLKKRCAQEKFYLGEHIV